MNVPSTETLLRLFIGVGAFMTGVTSTVIGSWISSKIHVYHENRKVHLDEIKDKVLLPVKVNLSDKYAALVKHRTSAVLEQWGTTKRIEGASVVKDQIEQGPSLAVVLPDILEGVDPALYADAKKKHFLSLVERLEAFDEGWRAHAKRCHAWTVDLSDEIFAKSGMLQSHLASHSEPFVNPYKLALYIYRRLFDVWERSLTKHSPNHPPVYFLLEGFEGTSARGTDPQLEALVEVLDALMVTEKSKADELMAEARKLDQNLTGLMAELNYAIAYRRLRNRCDLVPFF